MKKRKSAKRNAENTPSREARDTPLWKEGNSGRENSPSFMKGWLRDSGVGVANQRIGEKKEKKAKNAQKMDKKRNDNSNQQGC
jgi:hypothetical protein